MGKPPPSPTPTAAKLNGETPAPEPSRTRAPAFRRSLAKLVRAMFLIDTPTMVEAFAELGFTVQRGEDQRVWLATGEFFRNITDPSAYAEGAEALQQLNERWARAFEDCVTTFTDLTPSTFVSPASSDVDDIRKVASSTACDDALRALDEQIGDRKAIVRVDRIELSKNIARGFLVFDAWRPLCSFRQSRHLRRPVPPQPLGWRRFTLDNMGAQAAPSPHSLATVETHGKRCKERRAGYRDG